MGRPFDLSSAKLEFMIVDKETNPQDVQKWIDEAEKTGKAPHSIKLASWLWISICSTIIAPGPMCGLHTENLMTVEVWKSNARILGLISDCPIDTRTYIQSPCLAAL